MAEKRCNLGLSCELMMQSNSQVEVCPNLSVCNVAQGQEPLGSRRSIVFATTRSGKSVFASALLSAILIGEEKP